MIKQEEVITLTKKLESKHQCWDQIYDFKDTYIVVKGAIAAEQNTEIMMVITNHLFLKTMLFINCISEINGVLIDNSEDLDVVIPMYNFIEYSKNYRKTTGSLWNYDRHEPDNDYLRNSKSFKDKTCITGNTPNDNKTITDAEIVVLLKHLSNFWKSLSIPLINCEVSLTLT